MQVEEQSARLLERLTKLLNVCPELYGDVNPARALVAREPKLWTLMERLESRGELKIAQELRVILEG